MVSFEKSNFTDRDKYEAYKKRQKAGDRKRLADYISNIKEPCLFCGSEDEIQFHHVNANEKLHEVVKGYSKKSIKEEAEKCWCLCKGCHQKLHQRLCDPLPATWDIRRTVH